MKRNLLWSIILCLIIVSFVFAAEPTLRICHENPDGTRLSLLWNQKILVPMVEVKVGEQTLRLALDTGANQATLAITPDAVKRLNMEFLPGKERTMDVNGKQYEARSFILPSVSIGDLQLENLIAAEELRPYPDEDDGIIGNGVLGHFHVYLDYRTSQMILYPNTTVPRFLQADGWIKMPFAHEKIGIIVPARLPGSDATLRFCLDTGVYCGIQGKSMGLIRPEWIKKAERREIEGGSYLTTDRFFVGPMDCGPMDFWSFDFKQPPVDGFLGHNFLKDYQVLIDFADQNLYLKPNQG